MLISFLIFTIFATPAFCLVAFLVGLFDDKSRGGLIPGIFLGILGFIAGAAAGGGFGQSEGWGWGNVGSAIAGTGFAGAGFLLGYGISCTLIIIRRPLGFFFILSGVLFPCSYVGIKWVQPAITRSEMSWWQPILKNGYTETSEEPARAHLSDETKQALDEYIYRHTTGDLKGQIPASTLNLLFDLHITVSNYNPLPIELAEKIYSQNPIDLGLAGNPSTPPEILAKMSREKEPELLKQVAGNSGTPPETLIAMSRSNDDQVLRSLATNKNLSPTLARQLYTSLQDNSQVLCGLARNANTPLDLLVEMSQKNDVDVLYQLSLNPSLPKSTYPEIEERCAAIMKEEKAKPGFRDYNTRYNDARWLQDNLKQRQ